MLAAVWCGMDVRHHLKVRVLYPAHTGIDWLTAQMFPAVGDKAKGILGGKYWRYCENWCVLRA